MGLEQGCRRRLVETIVISFGNVFGEGACFYDGSGGIAERHDSLNNSRECPVFKYRRRSR